jgi:hypothetical protein
MENNMALFFLTTLYCLLTICLASPLANTSSLRATHSDDTNIPNTTSEFQDLKARARYGSCFDYCSGPDATGACMRNICTDADSCQPLRHFWHIESIMWQGGGTHCTFWRSSVCNGERIWMPDPLPSASRWGWDMDRMNSFRCYRDF